MDYNHQSTTPSANYNSHLHCHPSVVVVGVKPKPLHEGSPGATTKASKLGVVNGKASSLLNGDTANGHCAKGQAEVVTPTNGHHHHHHLNHIHHHHHHLRDAVENVQPLNGSDQLLNRYFGGGQQQNGKTKDNNILGSSNGRRIRNRSESSEPAEEEVYYHHQNGARNAKVTSTTGEGAAAAAGKGLSASEENATLKRSREEATLGQLMPLKFADEWLIEDLHADERGSSDKELVSPPAKVVNNKEDQGDQAESEYSSLEEEDADEDDEEFGDETAANDESLEEDLLDAMTTETQAKEKQGAISNGGRKAAMKELEGTVSGCVTGGRPSGSAPFSQSLFPNVPLYFSFANHLEAGPTIPPCIAKIMKWKLTPVTPVVVRKVLLNTGFRLLKQTNDWMGIWGKHMKSPQFRTIRSYQKFNHIPGSFQIGRKDRVWRNLENQIRRNGKKEFGFMPRTYILPQDLKSLRQMWPKYCQQNVKWIIKPPASARGVGIKVVNRWSQIPKRKPIIVQRYVERPFLIQGSKFDLRLYVLVTSINPLRIYLHTDGLARFASVRYSENADTLGDRYMHLTNYSINKLSANYAKNEDADQCQGHKWTLRSLWQYLEETGVHTDRLWGTLRNLIIRTLLAGESPINNMTKANLLSKYNCFELFGFDVLLDADLSPWLLEVNISPSLHSASPLDLRVKAPLVQAVLNTAMYQVPPKLVPEKQQELLQQMGLPQDQMLCHDKRIYTTQLTREERVKHSKFVNRDMSREEYLTSILDELTADDVRCLINTEDELARCAPLERIFPAPNTHNYLEFTENPRYYNRLLDAWETKYSRRRPEAISLLRELCERKVHLQVPPNNASARKAFNNRPPTTTTTTTPPNPNTPLSTTNTSPTSNGRAVSKSRSGQLQAEEVFSSGPPSESYRESSVESISTTTSTLSECTSSTPSILPLSTSSSGTDATKDMVSSSFSSLASQLNGLGSSAEGSTGL